MATKNRDYDNIGSRHYGVVVDVQNIDRLRSFYYHILELGDPVVESNFWVEFQDPESGLIIALNQTGSASVNKEEKSEHTTFCIQVKELERCKRKLSKHGVKDVHEGSLPNGYRFVSFSDPEANRIMAIRKDQ